MEIIAFTPFLFSQTEKLTKMSAKRFWNLDLDEESRNIVEGVFYNFLHGFLQEKFDGTFTDMSFMDELEKKENSALAIELSSLLVRWKGLLSLPKHHETKLTLEMYGTFAAITTFNNENFRKFLMLPFIGAEPVLVRNIDLTGEESFSDFAAQFEAWKTWNDERISKSQKVVQMGPATLSFAYVPKRKAPNGKKSPPKRQRSQQSDDVVEIPAISPRASAPKDEIPWRRILISEPSQKHLFIFFNQNRWFTGLRHVTEIIDFGVAPGIARTEIKIAAGNLALEASESETQLMIDKGASNVREAGVNPIVIPIDTVVGFMKAKNLTSIAAVNKHTGSFQKPLKISTPD